MAKVNPIPPGYRTLTSYLVVKDARAQVEFLKKAFDAKVEHAHERPDGSIGHASLQVGDSKIMVGQAMEGYPAMPTAIYMYVPDCDAVYKRALSAGATSKMTPADQFCGDRNAGVEDMNGNQWWMATHVEDVSEEELKRRAQAMGK